MRFQAKAVDLFTRRILLLRDEFNYVKDYEGVPVYAAADKECREKHFDDVSAFEFGEGIFVKYKSYVRDKSLMRHEHKHVEQLRRLGFLFPVLYLWEEAVEGYENNRFELEARRAEAGVMSCFPSYPS